MKLQHLNFDRWRLENENKFDDPWPLFQLQNSNPLSFKCTQIFFKILIDPFFSVCLKFQSYCFAFRSWIWASSMRTASARPRPAPLQPQEQNSLVMRLFPVDGPITPQTVTDSDPSTITPRTTCKFRWHICKMNPSSWQIHIVRCQCQSGYQCRLTDNRLDRKAYIFHCRNTEASRHMYPFPSDLNWQILTDSKKQS